MRRLQPAFDGLEPVFVSVHSPYAEEVPGHRYYAVRDVTRLDRIGLVTLVAQLTFILLRERPHVVVTTGSAPGMIAPALAKCLLRSRTMWIDSIANCEQISLSGMRAKRFCDVWLTQWPHLQRTGGHTEPNRVHQHKQNWFSDVRRHEALRRGNCVTQVQASGNVSSSFWSDHAARTIEYVCRQKKIECIVFGASSKQHIKEIKPHIDAFDGRVQHAVTSVASIPEASRLM